MEGIQINVGRADANPDISVIRINGYIDTTTSSELERVIQNLLREQRFKIIVDLSGVDYISSAGWGIFISEIKNLRSHKGDLKLANMSENVNEVYELLEFSTILSAAGSLAEAVKLFDAAAGPGDPPVAGIKPALRAPSPAPPVPRPSSGPVPTPARPVPPAPAVPVRPAASVRPVAPAAPAAPAAPTAPAASVRPVAPAVTTATAPVGTVPRDPASIPLIERVQEVVRVHPDWGGWKIKSELNRRRGPLPKVSWGEVRAELKFNGLRSKAERFRFARGR